MMLPFCVPITAKLRHEPAYDNADRRSCVKRAAGLRLLKIDYTTVEMPGQGDDVRRALNPCGFIFLLTPSVISERSLNGELSERSERITYEEEFDMRRLGHARYWMTVLAGLALVAAACAGSGVLPGGKQGPPAQPLTQTHTNEAGGFSMDLPEGWTAETFLLFTIAAEGAQSAEIAELTGPVIFASGWPASEVEDASTPRDLLGGAEMEDVTGDLTIGELEDTTVGGQPAAAADVSGSDPDSGQELEGRLVVVLGSENAGFFFGATPVGGWEEFAPTFDAIMDSV
jgi:hypothetical protein